MKKLIAFDLDGTLFKTNARVALYVDGVYERHFKDAYEYHDHLKIKQDNHSYDYSEYISTKAFLDQAEPIEDILYQAKRGIFEEKTDVILLTARSTMDDLIAFKKFFKWNGLDPDQIDFNFCGDLRDLHGRNKLSAPEAKKIILDSYLSTHQYNHCVVYDDVMENLEKIQELSDEYPEIMIETCYVEEK